MATKDLMIVSQKDLGKVKKALEISAKAIEQANAAIVSLAGETAPKKTRTKKAKEEVIDTSMQQHALPETVKAPSVKPVASATPPKAVAKAPKAPTKIVPPAKGKSNGSFAPPRVPGV